MTTEEMKQLRIQKLTLKQIAKRASVSKQAVWHRLRNFEYDFRKRDKNNIYQRLYYAKKYHIGEISI